MKHYEWTHIEAFKNVNRYVQKYLSDNKPLVTYRGKIKLHGTNAAVQITENGVYAQSRNNIITPDNDNIGFAKWLVDKKEDFQHMFAVGNNHKFIIYGEWAGTGIMKGTSVSNIGKRIFAIFALRSIGDEGETILYEPSDLQHWCEGLTKKYDDIHVLPWGTEKIDCDWNVSDKVIMAVHKFNEYVKKVEEIDPWVEETFGVKGNGEGYVFYPIGVTEYDKFCNFIFKAKGNKHKKEAAPKKKFVKVTPEMLNSINEFADMYATIDRFEQAVREACNNEFDILKTPNFLKWLGNDIQREGLAELEANNLIWNQVARECSNRARIWWVEKCDSLEEQNE